MTVVVGSAVTGPDQLTLASGLSFMASDANRYNTESLQTTYQ